MVLVTKMMTMIDKTSLYSSSASGIFPPDVKHEYRGDEDQTHD